jgi:hypothetical protein
MNKRELRNQQKGSLKHLKRSAPEVMTSSKESSSGDGRHKASRVVQWILTRLSIAEDWKFKATVILKGSEGIGCLFFKER